ncbi:hypothetical protein [Halorussus salinisoli]|uniref:hypothetical protein n=1 Tax=Halorussus salinisoli TaxID=2558242 RepID=UPI0010C16394|nr:hypothetical protein [Halorussus salinisoli]
MRPTDTRRDWVFGQRTTLRDTSSISARDDLDYASDGELLELYGVLVVGWGLHLVGRFVAQTSRTLPGLLVGFLVVLAGGLAFLVGIVAIARKLICRERKLTHCTARRY